MNKLTHFDEQGAARMVDISGKPETVREAVAAGTVIMEPATLKLILDRQITKGDVLGVARIAAIMAAKKTAEIIPMCHPLALTSVEVTFQPEQQAHQVIITARAKTTDKTGVEMEALTAVAAAGLTIYDMCKAVDREMVISDIRLIRKTGGKSGTFERESK